MFGCLSVNHAKTTERTMMKFVIATVYDDNLSDGILLSNRITGEPAG